MKNLLSSPKFITIAVAVVALIVIPLTLIQVQSQQNLRQNAETILWLTGQSANTVCATDGNGAIINVTFTNTEPNTSSLEMNVIANDDQTGKSVDMGAIKGGSTKTSAIQTGKVTLNAGTVTFKLSWTDHHSGTDSRTASYKAVGNCALQPTPTPPSKPTDTSGAPSPTPTICPTLGPVKNVHIDCPNCR